MIKGDKVSLRAMEPSDIELLYNWENDRKIWYISNTITPFSRFILEQYIMNAHQDIFTVKQLRLMIDLVEYDKTIGAIDLFDFDPANKRVGIGILIAEEFRGLGYASESLDLIIEYCFSNLMVRQVYCNILSGNDRSLKLFKSKGFQEAGLKKDWILIRNKFHDEYLLQLIK